MLLLVFTMSLRFIVLICCAHSLFLVYSRSDSYLLNTNKARAHLHGGSPDSFQTENSYEWGSNLGSLAPKFES